MNPIDVADRIAECVELASAAALTVVAGGLLTLPALDLLQRRRSWQGPEPPAEVAPDETALPEILVQLPVFNEPRAVAGLLESVAALDWPADKLLIQLLDDSTDETVEIAEAKVEQLRTEGRRVDHVRRRHRIGFKGAALADGLACSDAPYVAVLDADFRPPRQWLRSVVPRLMADPVAGFIQSRFEFVNADANWLTRAQGLLLDVHFLMEQGVRARAGLPIQFNGTAAVWRREAIDAAGGWSGGLLSEDLDLSIRAALAGWRGLFASDPPVSGSAPRRLGHWSVQQRRWSMGFAQTARALSGRIWASDCTLGQKVSTQFLLLYQAGLPLIVAGVVASLVDLALGCRNLPLLLALWGWVVVATPGLVVALTWPPYRALRRGGLGRYLATLAAIPLLFVFLAFSATLAVVRGFLGHDEVFHRTPKLEVLEGGVETALREGL